jgi:hypothetical protein
LTNATGILAGANLFTGSHYPGFVTFNKTYNKSDAFGMPGVTGLATNGDGQGFSIGWSELVPNWPTLAASFNMGSGSETVYGSDSKSESSNKMFDLHSTYTLSGFHLQALLQHQTTNATFPGFVIGEESVKSDTSSTTYGLSADHRLPWNGDFFAAWHRTGFDYNYQGGSTDGTTDMVNSNVFFRPWRKFSFGGGVSYTDNLSGALLQQIVEGGALPPPIHQEYSSHSVQLQGTAGYYVFSGLSLQGNVTHWDQTFAGKDYSNTLFGGTVNYNTQKRFLGSFTFVGGVMDNTNQDGHVGTTLVANVGFSRKVDGFDLGAHFGYNQNIQTLVAAYTTSSYSYGANVRRRIRYRTYWTASFSGGHSGLNQFQDFSYKSNSYSTSLTHGNYAVAGSYSKSDGVSLYGVSGIVTPAIPNPGIPPSNLIFYNSSGWSASASASPIHRMEFSGSYARNWGDTQSPNVLSNTYNDIILAQLRYPIRKLYFTAGYTRLKQGISSTGVPPTDVTTYYFGLSRWFNFF